MDVLSWLWDATQKSGPAVTLLLLVALFFMDKLWNQRFGEIASDVSEVSKKVKDMNRTVGEHSTQIAGLVKDRNHIKETVVRIEKTITQHDTDERSFWNEVRQFMLFQGWDGRGKKE